jgi:FtsH-binding integral membrane protein
MGETLALSRVEIEQRSFITKVYGWMSLALAITAGVAWYVASSPSLIRVIVYNRVLFFGLIIGELLLVVYLSGWIHRMSAATATMTFLGYSALNGLTFSVIFLAFTAESIATTFVITAGLFGVMSLYGYVTKQDLTSIGSLSIMGLLGVIIASVANIFLRSSTLYWIITYVGIGVFIGLIAYDTQKIKAMNIIGNEGTDEDRKEAIMGALALYLDFINLFLLLLRLFGRRR